MSSEGDLSKKEVKIPELKTSMSREDLESLWDQELDFLKKINPKDYGLRNMVEVLLSFYTNLLTKPSGSVIHMPLEGIKRMSQLSPRQLAQGFNRGLPRKDRRSGKELKEWLTNCEAYVNRLQEVIEYWRQHGLI